MSLISILEIVGSVITIIGFIALTLAYTQASIGRNTIDLMEIRLNEQDKQLALNQVRITGMESEIKVIKTLPLSQLSGDYHIIVDTLNSVQQHLGAVNKILQNQQESMQNLTRIGEFFYRQETPSVILKEKI